MKNQNELRFEAECFDLTNTLNGYNRIFNDSKNQIAMDTTKFSISSNNECKASKEVPDQKAIRVTLAAARKKPMMKNTVIIARYQWLVRHKLSFPAQMELPNLCLTIKEGKLKRAFFSNVLSHIIKKQNYYIQILN